MLFSWLEDAARGRPSARALAQGEVYLSYRGLLHRVERRATEFHALGFGQGDWVGLMLGNSVEFVVLTAALDLVGAVTLPLSPVTTDAEMNALMEMTPLRVVISHPRSGGPRDSGPSVDRFHRPVERRRLRGTLLQVTLYGDEPKPLDVPVRPHTAFAVAGPKGSVHVVLRTAENLTAEVENMAMALGFGVEDRVVSSVPLHTPQGYQAAMLLAMGYGGVLFLEDNLAPRNLVRLVRQSGVTVVPLWPGVLSGLSRYTALGAPFPKDTFLRMLSFRPTGGPAVSLQHPKVGGIPAIRVLHQPETGTVCMDDSTSGPSALVGRPVPGVQIRVSDGSGPADEHPSSPAAARKKKTRPARSREKSSGSAKARISGKAKPAAAARSVRTRSGRLWVKGRSVSDFRLESGAAEPVRLTDEDGFVDSGCRVKVDGQGRVSLVGRTDDLVEVDGVRISLVEVAEAFCSHPSVENVVFSVGQAPDSGEPLLEATVQTSGKVGSKELVHHASQILSPHKVPARVDVTR